MARNLSLGCMMLGALALSAGCQQSGGGKLASRGPATPMMGKGSQPPPPNFPVNGAPMTANGQRNTNTAPVSFTTANPSGAPANNTFPIASSPNAPTSFGAPAPNGPQTLGAPGTPTTTGRPSTVTSTQPGVQPPLNDLPPLPSPGAPLSPPGLSPIR